MVAGRKAGLDLGLLLDVLNSSSGVNFATIAARDVEAAVRCCDAHLDRAAAAGINALAGPER